MNPAIRLSSLLLALPRGAAELVIVATSVGGSLAATLASLALLRPVGMGWSVPLVIATVVPVLVSAPVAVLLMRLLRALEEARAEATALASIDSLTGALNRRRWIELAERELRRAEMAGMPVALLLLDIDDFKRINDHHGHAMGDQVLREVAATCQRALRPADALARWGGEEFVALLCGVSPTDAMRVAERLRLATAAAPVPAAPGRSAVTVSIGLLCAEAGRHELSRLVSLADEAMYLAKQQGKNRVEQRSIPAAPG